MIIEFDSSLNNIKYCKSIGERAGSIKLTAIATNNFDNNYLLGGALINYDGQIEIGEKKFLIDSQGALLAKISNNEITSTNITKGKIGDSIKSVEKMSDGGYLVGGTFSNEMKVGDITLSSNGKNDSFIIKYSKTGEVEWAKSFGGEDSDSIQVLTKTSDKGYIMIIKSSSSNITIEDEKLVNKNNDSNFIIKYSKDGEIEWIKSYEGDNTNGLIETTDGDYIVTGTFTNQIKVGDTTLNSNGEEDSFIIKYSKDGEIEYTKSFGGEKSDNITSLTQTIDGGYIVVGSFSSQNIKIGNEILKQNGQTDGFIIKYSKNGEIEWTKVIGGIKDDLINGVSNTADGGFIVVGQSNSTTIYTDNKNLNTDNLNSGLVIKYSNSGKIEWSKIIENTNIMLISETEDGSYILGGEFKKKTIAGNQIFTTTDKSGIIIKLSKKGNDEWAKDIKEPTLTTERL